MMKYGLAALLTCICLSTFADVDKSKVLVQQRVQANYGVGCNIAAIVPQSTDGGLGSDPETGMGGLAVNPLPKNWKSRLDSLGFNLSCKSSDDSHVRGGTYPITYDSKKNEWQKDASAWEKEANGFADKFDRKALLELIRVTNVNNVRAVNSQGWVMTQKDTIGDERWRKRTMSFCLLHPPKAICGVGVVSMLSDGPKGDLTQHALKIIKSIEFLPDVAPNVAPATTSNGELRQ